MTQKELIRQKIENSIKAFEFNGGIYDSYEAGELSAYKEILDFIDSLPEEKLSYVTDSPGDPGNPGEPGISDLEKAALEYIQGTLCDLDDGPTVGLAKGGFIAGAEWQKSQMTKDAVEGEIGYWNQSGLSIRLDQSLEKLGYGEDTDVKVIIVKQDDKPRD